MKASYHDSTDLHSGDEAGAGTIEDGAAVGRRYSYRSASIGLSAAALRAGQNPKNTPTPAENPSARPTVPPSMTVGQPVNLPTSQLPP